MKSRIVGIGLLLASTANIATPSHAQMGLKTLGGNLTPFPADGSANCPAIIAPAKFVRVSIPDDFITSTGENHVGTLGIEDDESLDTPITSQIPKYSSNPFHIDLKAVEDGDPQIQANAYVEVRIVLTGAHTKVHKLAPSLSAYKFSSISAVPLGQIVPVIVSAVGFGGNTTAGLGDFCAGDFHNAGDAKPHGGGIYTRSVAYFYVRYRSFVAANGTNELPYNIILAPIEADDTPIIIDPKIENNG